MLWNFIFLLKINIFTLWNHSNCEVDIIVVQYPRITYRGVYSAYDQLIPVLSYLQRTITYPEAVLVVEGRRPLTVVRVDT